MIPPDPLDQDASKWMPGGITSRDGNKVTPYWNLMDYYAALGTSIRSHRANQGDFVYFADWQLELDTFVDPPSASPRQKLRDLLVQASNDGVSIRALLDDTQNKGGNTAVAQYIGRLKGGGAVVDPFHQLTGSHHQKFVVARVGEGMVAYCGGCDIANERLGREGYTGPPVASGPFAQAPWHDMQVKVEGGAAADLWQSFVNRFKEVSTPKQLSRIGVVQSAISTLTSVPVYGEKSLFEPQSADFNRKAGELIVGVVRTYPNISSRHLVIPSTSLHPLGYSFAPSGERTILKLILNAIDKAETTIYLEDQYLVDSASIAGSSPSRVTDALSKTISKPSFKKMVIIIHGTASVQGELYQAASRRKDFFNQLGPDAAKKVAVYWYKPDLNSPYWFHSKTWVFDDRFAIVSSANCNRRSYSCDSEVGVGVADYNQQQNRLNFAHNLRMQLWLKHLNARPSAAGAGAASPTLGESDVLDFVSAAPLWDSAPLLDKRDLASDGTPDVPLLARYFGRWIGAGFSTLTVAGLLAHAAGSRNLQWDLIDPDAS